MGPHSLAPAISLAYVQVNERGKQGLAPEEGNKYSLALWKHLEVKIPRYTGCYIGTAAMLNCMELGTAASELGCEIGYAERYRQGDIC